MPDEAPPVETGQGEPQTPPDYRQWIPEPYRTERLWDTVPDLPTLTKNYAEAQKYIGGSVRIPKEDAPPEEWNAFYSKMGRPENPEAYQLQLPDMPEGLQIDEPAVAGFKTLAHGLGLNNKQLQGVLSWFYGEYVPGQAKAFEAEYEAGEKALKEMWGAAYENKIGLAKQTFTKLGNEALLQKVHDSGLGNDPAFIQWVVKVGEQLLEDGIIPEASQSGVGKEQALQKIAELTRDPQGPYYNSRHHQHAEAVEEVRKLYEIAYN